MRVLWLPVAVRLFRIVELIVVISYNECAFIRYLEFVFKRVQNIHLGLTSVKISFRPDEYQCLSTFEGQQTDSVPRHVLTPYLF